MQLFIVLSYLSQSQSIVHHGDHTTVFFWYHKFVKPNGQLVNQPQFNHKWI